jgi:NADH dehydrogenase
MAKTQSEWRRAVVVGGGAGGLQLAIRLAKRRERDRLHVTLIDKNETHIWKPLLHEVASGSMYPSTDEVDYLALARWHGFTFCHGAFEGLDRDKREVLVGAVCDEEGIVIPPRRLPYDVVVLAVGSVTNSFGVPGVEEYTFSLDDAQEAEQFHRRLVHLYLRANYAPPEQRPESINVVIVGGGATGVELAAELRSATRVLTAFGLDNIDADSFLRLTILNMDPRVLLQLPERISDAVTEELGRLGVAVRNSEQVVKVAPDHLETKSGGRYPADLVVWAGGVKAADYLKNLDDLETNKHNQIVVTERLQTTRDPRVLAMGDCAAAPWLGRNKLVPPRAQAAEQQARYLARAIPRLLAGQEVKPFRYNDLGSFVSLGEENTIGTLMGYLRGHRLRLEGFIAHLIYRWLYKRHQAALFGWSAAILTTIGNWLRGTSRPRVKLH